MQKSVRGFTLVEMVIVTFVLGILILIGAFGFGGYVNSANDRTRETDTRQWAATFDLYKNRYMVYPVMPASASSASTACLGKFPATLNRCGTYHNPGASYADTTADAMITMIQNVSKTPKNAGEAIKDTFSGPFVRVSQSSNTPPYTVTADFLNYFISECPSGFANVTTTSPYSTLIPSPNGTLLCRLQKSFTFNPG